MLLRVLFGWRSQSLVFWFQKSLTLPCSKVDKAYSLGLWRERGDIFVHSPCQNEVFSPFFIFHLVWAKNQSTPLIIEFHGDLLLLYLLLVGIPPMHSLSYFAIIILFQRGFCSLTNLRSHFVSNAKFVSTTQQIPSPPFSIGAVIFYHRRRCIFLSLVEFCHRKFIQCCSIFLQMPTGALKIESSYVGRLVRHELMRVFFPPFEIYEYFQFVEFFVDFFGCINPKIWRWRFTS